MILKIKNSFILTQNIISFSISRNWKQDDQKDEKGIPYKVLRFDLIESNSYREIFYKTDEDKELLESIFKALYFELGGIYKDNLPKLEAHVELIVDEIYS